MLLALAAILLASWILAFLVLHVSAAAVHVLLGLAILSAFVHTIRRRRYRGKADALPPDAVK
jgi:uncharacterized membrane protein YfcA